MSNLLMDYVTRKENRKAAICVRISEELAAKIYRDADELNVSGNQIVKAIITRYYEEK